MQRAIVIVAVVAAAVVVATTYAGDKRWVDEYGLVKSYADCSCDPVCKNGLCAICPRCIEYEKPRPNDVKALPRWRYMYDRYVPGEPCTCTWTCDLSSRTCAICPKCAVYLQERIVKGERPARGRQSAVENVESSDHVFHTIAAEIQEEIDARSARRPDLEKGSELLDHAFHTMVNKIREELDALTARHKVLMGNNASLDHAFFTVAKKIRDELDAMDKMRCNTESARGPAYNEKNDKRAPPNESTDHTEKDADAEVDAAEDASCIEKDAIEARIEDHCPKGKCPARYPNEEEAYKCCQAMEAGGERCGFQHC